jgi:hypothetical protein
MPEEPSWEGFDFIPSDERRPHWLILWFAIVLALMAVAAGAAWILAGPDALAWMAGQGRLLQ